MSKFQDPSVTLAVAWKTERLRKAAGFEAFLEQVRSYELSSDPETAAFESAIFAKDFYASGAEPDHSAAILELEEALIPVLARMEAAGVFVDGNKLRSLSAVLFDRSAGLLKEMQGFAGADFNPASTKQVQHVLFVQLGIPVSKKNKTGFSVDSEVLEEVAKYHPIGNLILEYRSVEKIRSTYAEGLLREIDASTGRIHTTYGQVSTATGRMSSENPNLQNIPSGSGFASEIKKAFRPSRDDWKFLVADYSQIEIRVLAYLSSDEKLLAAFKEGRDIHAETAKFLFPNASEITKDMRRIAKTVNFWVIYGITGFGLSRTLKNSPAESQSFVDAFFGTYSGVKNYFEKTLEEARKTGYVETAFGRRRYVPGLSDSNSNVRKWAEREALNMPVQGTAADVVKKAMVSCDQFLIESGTEVRMIMQVHDELVFEGPENEIETVAPKLREIMETAFFWKTLPVEMDSGSDWFAAK